MYFYIFKSTVIFVQYFKQSIEK